MKPGNRVVRVSLFSSEGSIGDRGTIRNVVKTLDGEAIAGCYVEWDKTGEQAARIGYVHPIRVIDLATWQQHQLQKDAA